MPPPAKKRDIADFFKPYARSSANTVPQKRPSPSQHVGGDADPTTKSKPALNKTPTAGRRLQNVANSPRSLVSSPRSATDARTAVSMPIRSPRPGPPSPESASTYKPRTLFVTERKDRGNLPGSKSSLNFADIPPTTPRVVEEKDVVVIRDSDDDSESLESLEDIFGRRKEDVTTSSTSPPEADGEKVEAERVKTMVSLTRGRSIPVVGKDKLRSLYAQERQRKFDISGILGDHFDDAEIEENVKKAQAAYEESQLELELGRQVELDRNLLAAVVQSEDGQDGLERLMNAVQRTEALASDKTFSFFGTDGPKDWAEEELPVQYSFPDAAIPRALWRKDDVAARSRAFLSGIMAELASRASLSDDVLTWTFHSVPVEPRDDLRHSYLRTLRECSPFWTRTSVSAQDVHSIFQILGAPSSSINEDARIEPQQRVLSEPATRDMKYLLAVLGLFQSICQDMDFMALSKLTSILCRLSLDSRLMTDSRIAQKVEECLERLLNLPDYELRLHVADRILSDIGHNLRDPTLQAQLLSHILPTSSTASKIRIQLAQIFLLGTETVNDSGLTSLQISLPALTDYISHSPFFGTRRRSTSDPVDYASLKALTLILDVAISDGGRPSTFSSRSEEHAFNRSVDHLADRIKAVFVSIADAGASHMRRTEAKDVLQALCWRLLYAVRTEARPQKHIFDPVTRKQRDGEEVRAEQRGKDFMAQYLAKGDQDEATGRHPLSQGSQRSESEILIRKQLQLSD